MDIINKKGSRLVTILYFFLSTILISASVHAARLPLVGDDSNNWGAILNNFLSVSHTQNGTLKNATVTGDFIINNSVFYVNSTTGFIGIGTAIPSEILTIIGNVNISGYLNLSGDLVVNNNFNVSAATGNVNVAGVIDARDVKIQGNNIQLEANAYKLVNFTSQYDNRADRFGDLNFTLQYDSRNDRWQLSNFSNAYDSRNDRFGLGNYTSLENSAFRNENFTQAYGNEYSLTGYKGVNLSNDLAAGIASKILTSNLTVADLFVTNNLVVIGNITSLNITSLSSNGSLIPAFDALFDLGNGTLRWRNANFSGIIQSSTITDGNARLSNGVLDASNVRINGNDVQVENSAFKLINFTTSYDSRADRWQLTNFTNAYDSRNDRFGNVNFTGLYDARTDKYQNQNFTLQYDSRNDRFANENFTSQYDSRADRFGIANYSALEDSAFRNENLSALENSAFRNENYSALENSAFRNENFTTVYDSRNDKFTNENFTGLYDGRTDRYENSNFTSQYDSRNDRFGLGNYTSLENSAFRNENYSGLENSAFRNENFTSNYDSRTDRFQNQNFTTAYDSRADRFGNANYSALEDSAFRNENYSTLENSAFRNENFTQAYGNEYSSTGYKRTNLTGDLAAGIASITANSITTNNLFVNNNLYIAGNITGLNITNLNVNGSFNPVLDGIFDLGNGTLRWRNANFSGTIQSAVVTDGFARLSSGVLDASNVRINGNEVQVENSAFKLINFTTSYDSRADRWQLANFTNAYDSRNDRFGLSNYTSLEDSAFRNENFTSQYDNRADRFGNTNFTIAYDSRSDRYGNANFTSQYDSRNDRYSSGNYSAEYAATGYKLANFTSDLNNVNASLSLWNVSGNAIFPRELTNSIGIGTTTPSQKLEVAGHINVTGTNSNSTFEGDVRIKGTLYGGSPLKVSGGLNLTSAGLIFPDGTSLTTALLNPNVNFSTLNVSNQVLLATQSGNVGIGTSIPNSKLDVAGTIRTTGLTVTSSLSLPTDSVDSDAVSFSYAGSTFKGGPATDVSFNYAGSTFKGGPALDVVFNYAGSTLKGGPAQDVSCIDCIGDDEVEDNLTIIGGTINGSTIGRNTVISDSIIGSNTISPGAILTGDLSISGNIISAGIISAGRSGISGAFSSTLTGCGGINFTMNGGIITGFTPQLSCGLPPYSPSPDVTVESVQVNGGGPINTGIPVTITSIIKNLNPTRPAGETRARLEFIDPSGSTLGVPTLYIIHQLAGLATQTDQVTLTPTIAGTYGVRVCANADGTLYESNLENNCNIINVQVIDRPDLIVESLTASPSSTVPVGTTMTLSSVIKNNVANTNAGASTARITVLGADGITVLLDTTYPISALSGLASQPDTSGNFVASSLGTYNVQVCADDANVVDEGNEGNNCQNLNVNVVAPNPDLIVESLQTSPSSPVTLGSPVSLTAIIKNNVASTNAALSSARVRITAPDGTLLQDFPYSVGQLSGLTSQTDSTSFSAGPSTGTYTIQVCADDSNAVVESNEGNNCQNLNVNVVAPNPDLVVDSLLASPSSTVILGTPVTLSSVIKNSVANSNAGASTARIRILGTDGTTVLQEATYPINALSGLATQTDTSGSLIASSAGTYNVQVCADDGNAVVESNEGNNCQSLDVKIVAPNPDLIVESITASPSSTVPVGTTMTLSSVIKNNVANTDAGASTARIKVFGTDGTTVVVDSTYPISALSGLASQTDTSGSFVASPAGAYSVKVCADDGNAVVESNEDNNCNSLTVNVQ